jgi:hypothetical protein
MMRNSAIRRAFSFTRMIDAKEDRLAADQAADQMICKSSYKDNLSIHAGGYLEAT